MDGGSFQRMTKSLYFKRQKINILTHSFWKNDNLSESIDRNTINVFLILSWNTIVFKQSSIPVYRMYIPSFDFHLCHTETHSLGWLLYTLGWTSDSLNKKNHH